MAEQKHELTVMATKRNADGKRVESMDIYCKQKPEVGFRLQSGTAENPIIYAIESILEYKEPHEFGAKELSWDMAPANPSIPAGLELSYSGVDGRDSPQKGKFFLTGDDHRQRAAFVKGDPNKRRDHGWHWARVTMKREY